jgi:hypothetical protein
MNGVGLGVTENVSGEPVGLGALKGVTEGVGLGELTGLSMAEQARATLPRRANRGRMSRFIALDSTPLRARGYGLSGSLAASDLPA